MKQKEILEFLKYYNERCKDVPQSCKYIPDTYRYGYLAAAIEQLIEKLEGKKCKHRRRKP